MIKPHSPEHFVGVDNVLEFTIVTADGNHVVANAYNNQDLFWALRGGGGGTWGVVTSVSYKTHPSTPFYGPFINLTSTNPDSTRKLVAEIFRLTPSFVEQGYGGYGSIANDSLLLFTLSPNVTMEQTNATFLPFFEFAYSLPGISGDTSTILYPDLYSYYDTYFSHRAGLVGVPNEISSWLLPKDLFENDPEGLAAEMLKMQEFDYL